MVLVMAIKHSPCIHIEACQKQGHQNARNELSHFFRMISLLFMENDLDQLWRSILIHVKFFEFKHESAKLLSFSQSIHIPWLYGRIR